VAGAGVVRLGGLAFCAAGVFRCIPSRTLPDFGVPRFSRINKVSAVIMNTIAAPVVTFDRTVAVPRGPNTVWEPIPPNAPAKSAALPLCSSTTPIKMKQIMTWIAVTKYNMARLSITSPLVPN